MYCPLAHWIFFTGGWLAQYGAIDFAGGMVVHTSSGVSAFVLTFWLGKSKVVHKPHNVPYVLLGAALLWFGWFGCVARASAVGCAGGGGRQRLASIRRGVPPPLMRCRHCPPRPILRRPLLADSTPARCVACAAAAAAGIATA